MNLRRRVTLQLTPLLDLLLIVIFAQYMEVQQAVDRQEAVTQSALEQKAAAEASQRTEQARFLSAESDLEKIQRRNSELERRSIELSAALQQARDERDRIAKLAAELVHIPDERLRQAISGPPAELDRIRKSMAAMPAPQAANLAQQLLAIDELRKACDIWNIHIDDNSVIRLSHEGDSDSFRAESPAEFERRFFEWYKTLPPPKTVVIIMFSWGDATAGSREAARQGIVQTAERMREDRNGRTLFEYVSVGFKPNAGL